MNHFNTVFILTVNLSALPLMVIWFVHRRHQAKLAQQRREQASALKKVNELGAQALEEARIERESRVLHAGHPLLP